MKQTRHLIALLMVLSLITTCNAQVKYTSEQQSVQSVVRNFFEGFSEASAEKFMETLAIDAKVLETGVIFTFDSVMGFVKNPRPADFKRVNTLDFFQTEVDKDMAFVSYYNTADFHANSKDRTVKWLESAVLVKEGKRWKIKMLHSTRLLPAKQ